jgi:murein L,D-transpeptidase YafK
MHLPISLFFLLFFSISLHVEAQSFVKEQLRYPRVRQAKANTEAKWVKRAETAGISWPVKHVYLRLFKAEAKLEAWTQGENGKYVLLHNWEVCAMSGYAGPKQRRGDLQVPEGLYVIDHFNPYSNFHLSVRMSYPNLADRRTSPYRNNDLGGQIYLHGDCVSIGCAALTDEYAEELYWLLVQAREQGQTKIPIHAFPCEMTAENMQELSQSGDTHLALWKQLRVFYDYFNCEHKVPKYQITAEGHYKLVE